MYVIYTVKKVKLAGTRRRHIVLSPSPLYQDLFLDFFVDCVFFVFFCFYLIILCIKREASREKLKSPVKNYSRRR